MERVKKYTSLILYTISGFLLGIGFIFSELWVCGWLGISVFVYAVSKTKSKWMVVGGSFIAWTIKSLLAVFWFWSTYPIEWIDLSLGAAEAPVVGFYWFTVSCFLGLGGIVTGLTWWFLRKKVSILWGLILFPFIWVGGEIASSFLFSLFTLGEGITLNTLFSFGYQGYLLANHELLIHLAKFGGVYALSLLASFLGYLGFLIYEVFPKPKSYYLILLITVALALTGFISTREATKETTLVNKITIAIIDTRFGDDFLKKENHELLKNQQINEAVESALTLNPDYILLPEDSRFTPIGQSAEFAYRLFRFQSSDSKAILIDSGRTFLTSEAVALRASIYDGISKKGWSVDKQYLVPQGEFMPYFYQNILNMLGMEKTVFEIQKRLNYRPGPYVSQAELPKYVPAILFCFESADPYAVRRLLKEREVGFVAHPISHAWFHESKILWHHFDLMLKTQAIWNNVPIVSAGNMVKGALYTSEGKKVSSTPALSGENWQVSLVGW